MTQFINSFEGQSSGTTLTAANSGGNSGTPFTSVVVGSGATVAFDNTYAAHGSNGLKIATGGSIVQAYTRWVLGVQSTVWFRFYAYFTANPSASVRLISIYDSSNAPCADILLNTSGNLFATNAAGSTISGTTTTNSVNLNGWFRVEGYVIPSTTVGGVRIQLFNTLDSNTATETVTSANTQVLGANTENVYFGAPVSQASISAYWLDDISVSTVGVIGPGAGLVSSDSGTGSEGVPVLIISDIDAGTGTDTNSAVSSTLSYLDSGLGVEGASVITIAGIDTGSGAGSSSLILLLSDAGSGADTNLGVAASTSSSDMGSGTDSWFLLLSQSDAGSGTEASSLAGEQPVGDSDSGSGSDSFTLTAILDGTDSGTGADTGSGSASSADSDTGSGIDSGFLIITLYDSGTGSEAYYLTEIWAVTESGTGIDAGTVLSFFADLDAGSGIGNSSLVLPLTDSGTGAEVYSLSLLPLSDTGSGSDAYYLPARSDFGYGAESSAGGQGVVYGQGAYGTNIYGTGSYISVRSADYGLGADLIIQFVSGSDIAAGTEAWAKCSADSGTGSEAGYGFVSLGIILDSGSGTETSSGDSNASYGQGSYGSSVYGTGSYVTTVTTDYGTGADLNAGIVASVPDSDTGAGLEIGVLENFPVYPADSDSGTGTDTDISTSLLLVSTADTEISAGIDNNETIFQADLDVAIGSELTLEYFSVSDVEFASSTEVIDSVFLANVDTGAGFESLLTWVDGSAAQEFDETLSVFVTLAQPIKIGDLLVGVVRVPDVNNFTVSDTANFSWQTGSFISEDGVVQIWTVAAENCFAGDTITLTSSTYGFLVLLVDHFSVYGTALQGIPAAQDYTGTNTDHGVLGPLFVPDDSFAWGSFHCADLAVPFTLGSGDIFGSYSGNASGTAFSAYVPHSQAGIVNIGWQAPFRIASGLASAVEMYFSAAPLPVISGPPEISAGTDAQQLYIFSADTASGADTQVPLLTDDIDGGSGAETYYLTVYDYDTGIGTSTHAQPGVAAADDDTAAGSDVSFVAVFLLDAETASSSDTWQPLAAAVASADAGSGDDEVIIVGNFRFVTDSDRGHCQEGDTEGYTGSDLAAGTESSQLLVRLVDSAALSDIESVFVAVQPVSDADSGTGTELWATDADFSVADAGVGSDSGSIAFVPVLVVDSDTGSGSELVLEAIDIYPFPPPWLFQTGTGTYSGYKLIWRPGTSEERVVREFERFEPWVISYAEMIRFSDSLLDVFDSDAGSGGEACSPTATVRQFVTSTRVTCEVLS